MRWHVDFDPRLDELIQVKDHTEGLGTKYAVICLDGTGQLHCNRQNTTGPLITGSVFPAGDSVVY